ncbi:DUF2997 domain-containing protein [Marinobacterium aestuariivivens]|uniref:DUF2997 domain-containing protein n=1 Tax=Marinobacterium aestuariivivens TaxID=1698799 RepID=A0ABW2A040_9GAMM
MPEQRITLTIDEQGGITAKTSGFKGETCLEALDELLDLEAGVSSVKKTDEYNQQVDVRAKTTVTQRRG